MKEKAEKVFCRKNFLAVKKFILWVKKNFLNILNTLKEQ